MFDRFLARQLTCPAGLFGRWFLAPLWNRRNAALNDFALDQLALRPDDHVLDVGFGGGYLLGRMAAVVTTGRLAGVDVSPTLVARAARHYRALVQAGRLELRCGSAGALPFPAGHFTKVCTVNSAFYWHDAARAFAEFRRVLVPGGRLAVCLTRRRCLTHKGFARHGLTLYEAEDIEQCLSCAGFRVVRTNHAADRHRDYFCTLATP